ncbi:MAG: 3-oxoacyl-ACP reductase FabG [Candidatus Tectomicrobia bacterium]|nr:3-oxoacyl-ACP reductase FabG [Candidatus Tectomicrobia bacterium]
MKLEGKSAIVTGSGRNIGRAIALAFAREGADVVINARSNREEGEKVAEEVRQLGRKALPILADVTNPSQVNMMAEEAIRIFGKVDILVNNVAFRPAQSFLEMTREDWNRVLDIGLNGPFNCIKAVIQGMYDRKQGRIINISGTNAIKGYRYHAHTGAAKGGLHGMTKALAAEFAEHGITVNTVVPGYTAPFPDPESRRRLLEERVLKEIPLGRLGKPEEIGALCAFLASDDAAFMTGQLYMCNGGAYMI